MMIDERFTCLFSLQAPYHTPGCPVVIRDGILLQENATGSLLAQLKLTVVGQRILRSVTVSIQPLDIWEKPIGKPLIHLFEDYGGRGTDLGVNKPVEMPSGTRSFRTSVVQVTYADYETQVIDGIQGCLPQPEPLERRLTAESCRQFRALNGEDSIYMPVRLNELWRCTCGELCHESTACHLCGRSTVILQDALDLAAHPSQPETPLPKAIPIPKKAVPTDTSQKPRRTGIIIGVAVVLIALVVAAVLLIPWMMGSPEEQLVYENALSMLEQGDYQSALAAFETLDGYRDSENMIKQIEQNYLEPQYQAALRLLENGDYESALAHFREVGNYRDAPQYVARFKETHLLRKETSYLNDELEYVIDCYYKGSRMTKEIFTATDSVRSTFHGLSIFKAGKITASYTYNFSGSVAGIDLRGDAKASIAYVYDQQGRLIREQVIGNGNNGVYQKGIALYDYHYEYDTFSNLIKETNYIDGKDSDSVRVITYTYDSIITFS